MWPISFQKKLRVICKNAGVQYKGCHAFRRCNITELCNVLGIPERIVGTRVGHGSTGMTLGVYNQAQVGCDKPWVDKIAKLIYEGVLDGS